MTNLKNQLTNDFNLDLDEVAELNNAVKSGDTDIEVGDYRFIKSDEIDDILRDELLADEYMLGCFNAWFIADILSTTTDAIEAMQNAGAFEGIGKMLVPHIDEVVSEYVSADGYGHHFATYDGHEHDLTLSGDAWLAFKVN